jgi:hypothetical protein
MNLPKILPNTFLYIPIHYYAFGTFGTFPKYLEKKSETL